MSKATVRAFIDGAKWWEYVTTGATMWQSDQQRAYEEAVKQYGGKGGKPLNPAAVALGSIKSPRKATSSRENGKKGGRPKKST